MGRPVFPRHPKDHDALGFDQAVENPMLEIPGMPLENRYQGLHDLPDGLVEVRLTRARRKLKEMLSNRMGEE